MKTILIALCVACCISVGAQSFTSGNLVVYRYGDGVATMPLGFVVPVFLDEYTTAGVLVRSRALPTTTTGLNYRITGLGKLASGLYQQEGMSTLSQDGKFITIFGYNQAPGGGVPVTSDGLVVGVIAADGSYNSTTTLSNLASASGGLGAPRSAIINGTDIWANGFNNGLQYTTLGALSTSVRVALTNQTSPRTLAIFGDTLYVPIGSSSTLARAYLPTTPSTFTTQTITSNPITPTINQCAFLKVSNRLLMYTTDDNTSAIGDTIRRFYLNAAATTWNLCGTGGSTGTAVTAEATTTDFTKSITAKATVVGDSTFVDLYLTTWGSDGTGTNSSKLLKFTDVYLNANPLAPARTTAITVLASARANTVFRSVTFAPVGSSAIGTVFLPLTLQSFSARLENGVAKLWWATSNAINVKKFEIEKSNDGNSFTYLASVVATNGSSLLNYTFNDASLTGNTIYYRLKIIDNDGTFAYSKIINVSTNTTSKATVRLASNPVIGDVLGVLHNSASKVSNINIFSASGSLVKSFKVAFGSQQSNISIASLSKGQYFVEYVDTENNVNATIKFIK